MGYYSDVALVLTREGDEKLREALGSMPHLQEFFDKYCLNHETDPETGAVLYYWELIKWYGEDCEQIDNLIGDLDGDWYCFMRVGESVGDCEERGNYYDDHFDLRIETSLQYDCASSDTGTLPQSSAEAPHNESIEGGKDHE